MTAEIQLAKKTPSVSSPPSILPLPASNSKTQSTASHHTVNASGTFTIKTSKKWVLPPRPKPGRKPTDGDHAHDKKKSPLPSTPVMSPSAQGSGSLTVSSTPKNKKIHIKKEEKSMPSAEPILKKLVKMTPSSSATSTSNPQQPSTGKKRGRKSNLEKLREAELANNPIKQLILKINEENYYLKLEVIKLVSDLKSLKLDTQTEGLLSDVKKEQELQQQDITSIPMAYNSTSMKTINNNTIYRINSNTSTNPSTPMMSNTTSSSPLTTATSPAPDAKAQAQQHGKKRPHDEDVNDLILSLVDLNHSNTALTSNNLSSLSTTNDAPFTNFLNLEEKDVVSASPNHEYLELQDEVESIDIESLTPNSLLSLSKTNSTIEEVDTVDGASNHHHFSPKLIDIPEIPLQPKLQLSQLGVSGESYDFSFWKGGDVISATTGSNLASETQLKKTLVFNTNSTIDELVMARQREREQELLKYNEFNDLLDFEDSQTLMMPLASKQQQPDTLSSAKPVQHVVFNDDWKLDGDDLLNF